MNLSASLLVGFLSAVVPSILGLLGLVASTDRQPRDVKRLVALTEARKNLDSTSPGAGAVDQLIATLANSISDREAKRQPLNPTNVGLTIVVSAGGGLGSYFLLLWALSAGQIAWLAWILFVVVALFTLLFIAGGIGTFRNPRS